MQYAKILIPILIVLGGLYLFFEKDKVQTLPPGVFQTVGEYFFIDREKVDRIELTSNNDITVLTKNSGNWYVESPVNSPAEPETIKTLLSRITQNPVHRVLPSDEIEQLSEYGLENVSKSITLYGGAEPILDLKFGDENPDGSGFYAKKGGGSEIIITAVQIMDTLDFDPNTFRSHSPLQIDENSVTSLKIIYTDSYWHLDKRADNGNWYISEPQMFRAKNTKINRLLSQLNSLKITKFLNERFPDDNSHGLNSSGITVEIKSQSGAGDKVEKIIFGDTNVAENAIYARFISMPDEDVLVESSILNKLKLNADDIRENSLFILDPLQIDTLDVRERGAKNLSIYQTPQDQWQIMSPRSGDVDEESLKNFFKVLMNLRPDKYISKSELAEIDPDVTGFEAYTAKIEIKFRSGVDPIEIVIGKKIDYSGYYTTVNDIEGACFIPEELITKFFDANNRLKGE